MMDGRGIIPDKCHCDKLRMGPSMRGESAPNVVKETFKVLKSFKEL